MTIVIFVGSIVYAVWYYKTNNLRKYKNEVYRLSLFAEHQEYEIKILKQASELTQLKREANRIKPSYQSEKVE